MAMQHEPMQYRAQPTGNGGAAASATSGLGDKIKDKITDTVNSVLPCGVTPAPGKNSRRQQALQSQLPLLFIVIEGAVNS